jgi:hypothetical protein
MFGKIWEQLKEHKFLVFAVIAGVIFLGYMRGSSSGSAATVDPNAPGGDNSLAAAQLGAQSEMHATDVQGAAAQAQIAAGGHAADLAYQLQSDANQLNANIANQQMADSLQYLTAHDTLQAQVANKTLDAALQAKTIDAAVQKRAIGAAANVAQAKAAASVQVAQATSCAWYNPTCW